MARFRPCPRENQSTADLAALAAGEDLGLRNYADACQDAVNYVSINATDIPAIDAVSFCAQSGNDVSTTVCSGGALAQATPSITAGKYTVSVHFPVPDAEIADASYGSGINDETPCERMRVIVTTTEGTSFGGVVGVDSFTATRSATVVAKQGTTGPLAPALWVLDPTGCTALSVAGGSEVTVGSTSPEITGIVAVESDGTTCASNDNTISVSGSGTRVRALPASGPSAGTIGLAALPLGATTCASPRAARLTSTTGDSALSRSTRQLQPGPPSTGSSTARAATRATTV